MPVIVGIVSKEEKDRIIKAGYDLFREGGLIEPLLDDMEGVRVDGEEPIALWVDCDVTELLDLRDEEGDADVPYSLNVGFGPAPEPAMERIATALETIALAMSWQVEDEMFRRERQAAGC